MQIPFPFESMILFGSMSLMLLIGVLLRAKVSLFQHFLIPSCLLGGILGLIVLNVGILPLSSTNLESFAYHCFNISFISVGLTQNGDNQKLAGQDRYSLKGPLWMALTQSVVFPLQAIIGGCCIGLFSLMGMKLFPTFGFFAPLGFEEGPGQALSFGKVWEGFGFEHAATIGLTFAAIGFFFSFFVGVPLVNWGVRKGLSAHGSRELPQEFFTGVVPKNKERGSAGKLAFHSGNIDSLAFQSALVGFVYILTYVMVKYVGLIVPADVGAILWGFFFIFGLGCALIVRRMMRKFGVDHLIDSGIQRRITGWSVDYLIVATIMAIQLTVVWQYFLPIATISIITGAITTLVVIYLGKRIESYNLERMVAIYGTVTGTVSTGLLLLRIADPDFRTPVAIDIALMNVFSIPSIGLYLIIVNGPVWWNWSVWTTALVFFMLMIIALGLLRALKLWGPQRKVTL
jgi:ESS family glutamate:Na+ symporter